MVRIQTSAGSVDNRNEYQKMLGNVQDIFGLITGGNPYNSSRYSNQNIGTFINLTLRGDYDINYLSSLKTGDWITVRGVIDGVTMRNIDLSPAMLEHNSNMQIYSDAKTKVNKFNSKLAEYKARTCSNNGKNPPDGRFPTSGKDFDINLLSELAVRSIDSSNKIFRLQYVDKASKTIIDPLATASNKLHQDANTYMREKLDIKGKCKLRSINKGEPAFIFNENFGSYTSNCKYYHKLNNGRKIEFTYYLQLPYELYNFYRKDLNSDVEINFTGIVDDGHGGSIMGDKDSDDALIYLKVKVNKISFML
jgi:hypothetical protein